ncbi:MAG: efflux RND transporter periplasmic adaptor subunit, partial [Planctomycetota bacterium]
CRGGTMKPCAPFVAAALLLTAPSGPLRAQEGPGDSVVARRGTLRVTLERPGRFVPADAAEISLDLEAYRGELLVLDFKGHGAFVDKGDVLVTLDTRPIQKQLAQAELDLALAEQAHRDVGREGRLEEEREKEKLAAAVRAHERARRALEGYHQHEKGHRAERKRLDRLAREHREDDLQDELEQLEKMYGEDELVDATEEIVLKRSRRNLARTRANNELRRKMADYDEQYKEIYRPEDLRLAVDRTAAALDRLRRSQEVAGSRREAAGRKRRFQLELLQRKVEELRRDRERLTVRAPRPGLLLHGPRKAAPWSSRLRRGGKLKSYQVIVSVADPERLEVSSSVEEKDLLRVRGGAPAEVAPRALPEVEIGGSVEVGFLAATNGRYDVEVRPDKPGRGDPRLRPGMSCDVTVVVDPEREGILLPWTHVAREGASSKGRIRLRNEAGGFDLREVELGPGDDRRVIVERGLAEGERVWPKN